MPATISMGAPGLVRRLAAILYDSLLLFATLYFATLILLPFNGGEAIRPHPLYTLYLFAVSFLYFAWAWTRGGQTLGMRAWRLRVVRRNGLPLTWGQAALRFLAALLSWLVAGAGFWWVLVDSEHLSWHDRLSATKLVLEPRY